MTGGNTVETDDSPVPAEAASRLDQITKLADEAVNNAAIAGRFFSLAEMEQKIGEGQACLVRAEALLQQQDAGPSLAAALNSCHLDRAERIIAGGNADPQLVQRYEALRRMKQTYGSQFTRMQDLYRECRFDQAASVLAEAYRQLPPECDTARSEAARAFTSVKATADKSRSAERAYAEADNYYRQGDYANSYRRLQQARQDAACTTQITRIDNGLKQVAEKLHTAGNTPAQVNTGTGTENPVCLRYQQQLTALGNRQQQLAAQSQRISTAEQAKALQTTLMQNSRQFVTVMDQARAAGCHDVDLPPEVRQSLGMPAAASAGNGLQCKPPRVAGVSKKTGQPACMCPGELMWSKKSHQCLTFGQLINENGAMDKLDKALESTKHMSDTATGVPTMNRNSDLPDLRK